MKVSIQLSNTGSTPSEEVVRSVSYKTSNMENKANIGSEYFSFNDSEREVIITRPDTPSPWMNYLTNGTFHTMMSHAGGALAFYKSPQIWRINRYRFSNLPVDRSGMYIYIRNSITGEYWNPTYEPSNLKPTEWRSAHGQGYTRFEAERDSIATRLLYFVGREENALIWNLQLENKSQNTAELDLFGFVEFGMMEYMREVSWLCYMKHQMSVTYSDQNDCLIFKYGVESQPKPDETPLVYLACDQKLNSFDGDRDEFIGAYRSESNPVAVENGACKGSTLYGGDPCGALQTKIKLAPGETREINFFLGTGMTIDQITQSLQQLRSSGHVKKSFASLTDHWNSFFSRYAVSLPDTSIQRMINTWNPYQAERNFLFSRNISYYATGTFRGVGFRDTSQDILSMIPYNLEAAKEKLFLLMNQQYADGHTNHYFFPHEGWEPLHRIHSDNHLWIISVAWSIVMEEGSVDLLKQEVEYFDTGKGTVYDHLLKSIDFTMNNIGPNGLPLMLHSDWNDQMFKVCREGKGESFWTSMFLGYSLQMMMDLAILLDRDDDAKRFRLIYDEQKSIVNNIGWDGSWYRRAIMDNGLYLGCKENKEAQLWLNTQSWAVISGFAEEERGVIAMNSVKELLDSDLGIKLIHPPITDFPDPDDPLTHYNKGTGENAAVFCHANTWAIIAEAMLKRHGHAWKYYTQLIPENAMEKAGINRYKAEPYVYVSNLFGPDSDKFGLANVSWLTGTATWMHVAVTHYLMGLRPAWDGLLIDPVLPDNWNAYKISKTFRGTQYEIRVTRADNQDNAIKEIRIDGRLVEGNIIPHRISEKPVIVEVTI